MAEQSPLRALMNQLPGMAMQLYQSQVQKQQRAEDRELQKQKMRDERAYRKKQLENEQVRLQTLKDQKEATADYQSDMLAFKEAEFNQAKKVTNKKLEVETLNLQIAQMEYDEKKKKLDDPFYDKNEKARLTAELNKLQTEVEVAEQNLKNAEEEFKVLSDPSYQQAQVDKVVADASKTQSEATMKGMDAENYQDVIDTQNELRKTKRREAEVKRIQLNKLEEELNDKELSDAKRKAKLDKYKQESEKLTLLQKQIEEADIKIKIAEEKFAIERANTAASSFNPSMLDLYSGIPDKASIFDWLGITGHDLLAVRKRYANKVNQGLGDIVSSNPSYVDSDDNLFQAALGLGGDIAMSVIAPVFGAPDNVKFDMSPIKSLISRRDATINKWLGEQDIPEDEYGYYKTAAEKKYATDFGKSLVPLLHRTKDAFGEDTYEDLVEKLQSIQTIETMFKEYPGSDPMNGQLPYMQQQQ